MQWPQLRGQQTWVDGNCQEFTESVHDWGAQQEIQEAYLQAVDSLIQQACVERLLFIRKG